MSVMDSFSEPYTRPGDNISIEQARHNIDLLEQQHRKAGIPLSGRIIHVCHYLPITATIISKPSKNIGVLSPPTTPPTKASDPDGLVNSPESPVSTEYCAPNSSHIWSLSARYGHSAMISGIRSLSQTHQQLIVGWTGDVMSLTDKVPTHTISADERISFEGALDDYLPDPDEERNRKTKYVPVWLDDKVAHGHYDGYCKQSKPIRFHRSITLLNKYIQHSGHCFTTCYGKTQQLNILQLIHIILTMNLSMLLSPDVSPKFTVSATLSGSMITISYLFLGESTFHTFYFYCRYLRLWTDG